MGKQNSSFGSSLLEEMSDIPLLQLELKPFTEHAAENKSMRIQVIVQSNCMCGSMSSSNFDRRFLGSYRLSCLLGLGGVDESSTMSLSSLDSKMMRFFSRSG